MESRKIYRRERARGGGNSYEITLFQMSRLVADGILRGAGMMGKFMVATVLSILFYRTGVWFQKEAADV